MTNAREPGTRRAALIAAALTTIQAAPWIVFVLFGISFITSANESIAYRYFHSYRLIQGENGTIWEAQGQTLGLLQTLIQYALNWAGIESLRDRIDLFGIATLGINSLVFGAAVFFIAKSAVISRERLLVLAAVTVYAIYGSRWGIFAARLPDYYTWEVTLTLLCLGLFFVNRDLDTRTAGRTRIVALGALAGAMIGIKLTLAPAALLPMLPILLNSRDRPGRAVSLLAGWSISAAVTLGAIVVGYYHFDFSHIHRVFTAWRSFVSNPGSEPGFVQNLFGPVTDNPLSDHRFVWIVGLLWIAAAVRFALVLRKSQSGDSTSQAPLGLFILAASALHVVALVKRPAETTLYESSLFLVAAGGLLVGAESTARLNFRFVTTWSAIAVIWSGISASWHFPTGPTLGALRDSTNKAWDIHSLVSSASRPVLVYIPDNNYVSGTVEDALMKGFSDVPTWKITSGYGLLDEIVPGLRFTQELGAPPPDHLLMWADIPDKPPLATGNPAIGALLRQNGGQARVWTMQRPPTFRTVTVVPTETEVQAESLPVIIGSDGWRSSTSDNPIRGFSISPAETNPRIELRTETGRTYIRLVASKPSPYLALTGLIPGLPDGTGPLRIEAVVRTNRSREIITQFYDVVSADGSAETPKQALASPANAWTTHLVDKPALRYPSPSDNFSVGILDVLEGDVMDIEVLELRGAR